MKRILWMTIILLALLTSAQCQQTAKEWCQSGVDLYNQGKYDDAIRAYEEAIRLNPSYSSAWSDKGLALGEQGKYDEAVQAYDKAIKLDPNNNTNWYYNKGVTLDRQGKYDEAIQAYDEAIKLNPADANTWVNRGVAYYHLCKSIVTNAQGEGSLQALNGVDFAYNNALQSFDKAIGLNPNDAYAWHNKGNLLSDIAGEGADAVEAYDHAIIKFNS